MNKEITIYELMGLIKYGKAPKKIIFDKWKYEWDEAGENYLRYIGYNPTSIVDEYDILRCLNDKVEIIEEDNKIEKMIYNEEYRFSKSTLKDFTYEDKRLLDSNFKELMNKINELIDEIEKLKEINEN